MRIIFVTNLTRRSTRISWVMANYYERSEKHDVRELDSCVYFLFMPFFFFVLWSTRRSIQAATTIQWSTTLLHSTSTSSWPIWVSSHLRPSAMNSLSCTCEEKMSSFLHSLAKIWEWCTIKYLCLWVRYISLFLTVYIPVYPIDISYTVFIYTNNAFEVNFGET